MIRNLNDFTHNLLKIYLKKGMHVIDATVGNGNDTVFLSEQVGEKGFVLGFDIQKDAVQRTLNLLQLSPMNYKIIEASHEHLLEYCQPASQDLIVYNLGYLPQSDKSITTCLKSTQSSLESALIALKISGLISITAYGGHQNGIEETKGLLHYIEHLDAKKYHVMKLEYANQDKKAPFVILIEKKG